MKGSAFLLISLSTAQLIGANTKCAPEPPATCYPDDCCRTYCLGPTNEGISPAVRPYTCNGDWVITAAGLYWNAHMDGMEYAVDTKVNNSNSFNRANLIDAEYKNPDFKWDFGFKFGIGYNTTCDGWDIGVVWTRYHGRASSHDEAEKDDNHTLLPLWSSFAVNPGDEPVDLPDAPLFATDIETQWNLKLNLVDIELGREFWNSKRLTIRPHVGLRIVSIEQEFDIEHKGGSWTFEEVDYNTDLQQNGNSISQNNEVDLENDFKGVGIRAGLDTVWNFGCGWAIYGNTAFSIIYGRFHIEHDETNREAASPFTKTKILDSEESFRASRFIADLALGVQWSSLFCDCKYGFAVKLGWENHIFLDQNQLWRVNPKVEIINIFNQRRGTLDTQGWTLTFVFDF